MGNVTSRNSVAIVATAYPSQDAIQAFLLANTENAIAAVFFVFDDPANNSTLSGFVLETNTTGLYRLRTPGYRMNSRV